MLKKEFLEELKNKLNGLPKDDIDNRIEFYSEMIDDRIEEGKSAEEAIDEIGTVDEVVGQIAQDTPLLKLVKERVKPKRSISVWEIVLIVLGFPIWLPLLLVAAVLLLVAYLLIWVLVIVSYGIELSFAVAVIYSLIGWFASGFSLPYLAIAISCAGLAGFTLIGCFYATKLTLKMTKKIGLSIKRKFMTRG